MSTWALDVVAARRAGVLLAASHCSTERLYGVALGFLAVTYVIWAAGLHVNLIANWRLLEQTGTSTNALSKVGFELARRRSSSRRVVRAASVVGYVLAGVPEEAPYYGRCLRDPLVSDTVDATDALVFLGGANVGAAVYEYGLARLTGGYLNRRSRRIARTATNRRAARLSSSAGPSRSSPRFAAAGGGSRSIEHFVDRRGL